MKNSECIIEQYRGDTLVRSFTPTGDQTLAVEHERERQELPEDEWVGLVEDTADAGRGVPDHDTSHPERGQGAQPTPASTRP